MKIVTWVSFSGVRLPKRTGPLGRLNGDGQPECYTDINDPSTLIAGCVPLNMFGGGVVDPVHQPTDPHHPDTGHDQLRGAWIRLIPMIEDSARPAPA